MTDPTSVPEPPATAADRAQAGGIDPLCFTYLDRLPTLRCGDGRLFLGRAAQASAGRPVLLFVHGAFHGAWCFTAYLRFFDRQGVPSAALDLRGHGGLAQGPDFHQQGAVAMASDVMDACARLPGPAVPVGHSAGGLFVAMAAAQSPVAGFGLLAPSPPANVPGVAAVPLVPEGRPLPVPALAFARKRYLDEEGRPRDLSRFMARLCPESPTMMNDRYALRITVDPGRFSGPRLCIAAGRDSPVTHPPGQDRATAAFLGCAHHELPDAPHSFMLAADWLPGARIILDWYRRHFGDGHSGPV